MLRKMMLHFVQIMDIEIAKPCFLLVKIPRCKRPIPLLTKGGKRVTPVFAPFIRGDRLRTLCGRREGFRFYGIITVPDN